MTIKDIFTPMADHLRSEYGTSDLLTVDQIKKGIDGLYVKNFLDVGQSYISDSPNLKALTGISVDVWNKDLQKRWIMISFDVKWSKATSGRVGIEYSYNDPNGNQHFPGCWVNINTAEGQAHPTAYIYVDSKVAGSFVEYHMYNQLNDGAHVEITNPKIVINPMVMGGK